MVSFSYKLLGIKIKTKFTCIDRTNIYLDTGASFSLGICWCSSYFKKWTIVALLATVLYSIIWCWFTCVRLQSSSATWWSARTEVLRRFKLSGEKRTRVFSATWGRKLFKLNKEYWRVLQYSKWTELNFIILDLIKNRSNWTRRNLKSIAIFKLSGDERSFSILFTRTGGLDSDHCTKDTYWA